MTSLGKQASRLCLGLLAVLLMAFVGNAAGKAIVRAREDRTASNLCRYWAHMILVDAKQSRPEEGTYNATLEIVDGWGQPLTSSLIVRELTNTVYVYSTGRDQVKSDDDLHYRDRDVHVRKSVLKGIGSGAHSAGKGFTSGVIEGLGEANSAAWNKAKEGAKKVKSDLMSKFKKEKKNEDD